MNFNLDDDLRNRTDRRVEDINTWLPCVVTRYDPDLQLVDVKPLVKRRVYLEDDNPVDESRPIVVNCPVHFIGDEIIDISFTIRDGTKAGDKPTLGIVMFCQDSLEDYLSSDGSAEVGPYEFKKHSISDGIFVPGVLPFARVRDKPPEDGIAIRVKTLVGPDSFKIELDRATMTMELKAPTRIVMGSTTVEVQTENFVVAKPDGTNALRMNLDGEFVP